MSDAPATIVIFDSGVGGLTVYREVAAARPDAAYVYVADDAGFPYGNLTEHALIARVTDIVGKTIAEHAPDLVVVACNTASTLALKDLRARFADCLVLAMALTRSLRCFWDSENEPAIIPCLVQQNKVLGRA